MNFNAKKPYSLLAVIAVSIFLVVMMVGSKKDIEHSLDSVPSQSAEVITMKKIPYQVRVTGYGNVVPAITFHSMSEVSGKILFLHPNLKSGETLQAGTVVIKIDASDYDITLKQSEADLSANRSALVQLEEEEKTTLRSRKLAKKNFEVAEGEYTRIKGLYAKQMVAKSTLDAEEQKVLSSRQQLEEVQGQINSFDSRKQSLSAQIIRAEREVENRQTILKRTEISLPFDARIGAVNVEKTEFVSVGTVLFEAVDLEGAEITAQIPMSSMRRLVSPLKGAADVTGKVFRAGGQITDRLKLKASVSLVNELGDVAWDAKVLRISDSIDATRQTLGIVVAVDKPYEKAIPGKRPPLIKGMYTRVNIYGQPHDAFVIPRNAIHDGRVYVASADNKLVIQPVVVQQTQGELAVIEAGLKDGDRVIVTDIFPVIEHISLKVTESAHAMKRLEQLAGGELE